MTVRFLLATTLLALPLFSIAQSTAHRVAGLQILPSGSTRLELQGNAAASQSRYFDLFPVERSVDLVRWTALGICSIRRTIAWIILQRTFLKF